MTEQSALAWISDAASTTGAARYERIRCLGRGGNGVVYEVFDHLRQRRIALKMLSHSTPLALYSFKQEFRALAEVRHPNLVHLHEFSSSEAGSEFFTMELVSGQDFRHYARAVAASPSGPRAPSETPTVTHAAVRPLPGAPASIRAPAHVLRPSPAKPAALRAALTQLVAGLRALHAAGKLHRDIKPSNVMVSTEGRVVILDFGLSTGFSHREADDVLAGTPEYMAPEQFLNEELQPASDWYAVGTLLFDALVGQTPFAGTMEEILRQKVSLECPRPSQLVSGVDADLDELCARLLTRDPRTRPNGKELARLLELANGSPNSNRGSPSLLPRSLVGRQDELEELERALSEARRGRPAAVMLHGSSGVGKSTLLSHFLERVAREGRATVFCTRVYKQESIPYKAVDGLLDMLSQHLETSRRNGHDLPPAPNLHALGQLFPVLRRTPIFAVAPETSEADPLRTREQAFEGLRHILGHVAREQPIVAAIDDAQWGDLDSVALLIDMLGKATALPILLVLSHREPGREPSPFLDALSRQWPAEVPLSKLPIGPLKEMDVRELVAATLGGAGDVADGVIEHVFQMSTGNAFLVQELAYTLLPGATRPSTTLTLSGPASSSLDTVLLDDRLRGLDEPALRLLEVVAASGRALRTEAAAAAAGVADGIDGAVSALSQRRLLRSAHESGLGVLEVRHDRIREWILARVSEQARRHLHRRLAETLEANAQNDPDLWLEHWLRSGDSAQIRRVALVAAARASERLALKRAEALYRTALAHGESDPQSTIAVCRALGQVLEWDGRGADAAQAYLRAAELTSGVERSALASTAGLQLIYSGSFAEGARLLRTSLQELGLPAPTSRLRALTSLGAGRLRLLGLERKLAQPSRAKVSEVGRARVDALHSAAFGFVFTDPLLGECMQAAHLAAALAEGTPQQLARALALEASQRAHRSLDGAGGSAERLFKHAERMASSSSDPAFLQFVHACRGVSQFLCGNWQAAHDVLEPAYRDVPRHRAGWHTSASIYNVLALSNLGRFRQVAERLPELLDGAEARGDRFTVTTLRVCAKAPLLLASGDSSAARDELRDSMTIWDQPSFLVQHWRAMWWSAETDLYDGLAGAARARCMRDETRLKKSFLLRVQYIRAMTLFLRARCALATFEQDPKARAEELRALQRQLTSEGRTWTAALAAIASAGLALRTRDAVGPVPALRHGADLAMRADMSAHAEACRLVLGEQLGGDEGRALRHNAEAELERNGVREPSRFAAALLPTQA